jgi:hypothetical protein
MGIEYLPMDDGRRKKEVASFEGRLRSSKELVS